MKKWTEEDINLFDTCYYDLRIPDITLKFMEDFPCVDQSVEGIREYYNDVIKLYWIVYKRRQPITDEERFKYLLDRAIATSQKMDGTSYWYIRVPLGIAQTPLEALDNLIKKERQLED